MITSKPITKRRGKTLMLVIISFLIVVAAVFIILPPFGGRPKPYVDENGKVIEGSISEKVFIDADDGAQLGMFITAKNDTKPVLLYLSGGPGIPGYFVEYEYPSGLDNDFIVCYPEYRGTGISYSQRPPQILCKKNKVLPIRQDSEQEKKSERKYFLWKGYRRN